MNRLLVSVGAWLAFIAVALGAFGTHGLRGKISDANLDIWHTAVQYHLVHALAMILAGMLSIEFDARKLEIAGGLFCAGIALFGGSLYLLAVTDFKVLGAITPLGGVCFLLGWVAVALSAPKATASRLDPSRPNRP